MGADASITKHDVSQARNNPRLSVFDHHDIFGPEPLEQNLRQEREVLERDRTSRAYQDFS